MNQRKKQKKNVVSAVAVAGIMSLGFTPAWAQQSSQSEGQQQQQQQRSGEGLISAEALKDSRVIDSQNREIGELNNLFIDPQTGRITRADIEFNGGLFGAGETYSVSWDQLSVRRQGDQIVVAVDQAWVERVEQAKQQGERSTQVRQRDERQTERGAYGRQGEKTRAQQGEQRQNDRGLFGRASEDQRRLSADQMSAEQIRKVQQQLNKEGFHAGSVDGKWSSQTQNAIRNFQESKGLQVTGQLDERTLDELGLDADEFREQSQPENKTGADQSSR